MESNEKLKEFNIKNQMCYYFDGITKIEDFYFDILINENHAKMFWLLTFHTTLIGAKPLRIRFDKVDGFIKDYNGTRYIVLFGLEECDVIYNGIRYLVRQKSGIKNVFDYNYAKIKADSYNSLPLEKTLNFHNLIVLI